ncbi:hypothetical protein CDL15_Pgr028278 [Punica granatum]|uniref:Uncharacterized protein n=1 Tax=Punica granatum TaxID=22663 RepID=A0A218WZG2_PUNGR|nr:hypothetical protein CDL15_Pgr028278 [Punica granatum]
MWTRSPKAINVDAESVDAESKSSKCGRGVQKAINVDVESKSSKCGRGVRKAIKMDSKYWTRNPEKAVNIAGVPWGRGGWR